MEVFFKLHMGAKSQEKLVICRSIRITKADVCIWSRAADLRVGWEEPDIKESFDPDRTTLTLKFIKKQAIKTRNNQEKIRLYLQVHETAKAREIAELLGLSMADTFCDG